MRTFNGHWPALLTPFTPDDQVNTAMLRSLVDYHLGKRVTGFYICGSTGEGSFQSVEERMLVAETVMKHLAGRAPVLVHVGSTCLNDAIRLAKHAQALSAAGISSILPAVVYDARGITPYFEKLAGSVPEMPFLPYLFGGTRDCLSLTRDLAHIPNFVGTKYFGANMYEMAQLVNFRSHDWTVFHGMDEQAALGILYGAHGVIGSSLNFMPGAYRRIFEHLSSGEINPAMDIQRKVNKVIEIMIANGFVGSMRAIMGWIGLPCGQPRLPNLPLRTEESTLRAQLEPAGLFDLIAL